jgi:putative peptidoglycan lipid II flippase
MKSATDRQGGGDPPHVARAAGVVGAATLLSRIFGYVRDMVLASFFGAGMAADAFIAAFRIPNLLRRLFGEGSLSIAFVPVFTETMIKGDRAEAFRLAVSGLKLLLVCLSVVALIGVAAAPLIVHILAPGFAHWPQKMALTVTLTRVMFPYIVLIGLVALCMGVLNVLGHFAAPAIAPVLLNLAMIAAVVTVSRFSHSQSVRAVGLAAGVLLGGLLQLALQLPYLVKHGVRFWKASGLLHPGMKKIGILMLPTIFGAAVYQINILVGTLLASLLPQGSVSYLYYADRLVQFPLGIFAQAAATAVLPSLSRQATVGDHTAMGATFGQAVSLVLFFTIPAMVGLIVLRHPIVALLFKHGAFDAHAAQLTSDALLYYALGLWAFAAVRIVVSAFYAMQDTRTPVKTATVSIGANILLGLVLMGPMRHDGLALATSLASMINLALLVGVIAKRLETVRWRIIAFSGLKTVAASVFMALMVLWIRSTMLSPEKGSGGVRLLMGTVTAIGGGIAVFCAAARLLRIPEWQKTVALMKRSLDRT